MSGQGYASCVLYCKSHPKIIECRRRTYEFLRFALPASAPRAPAQTVGLSFVTKPLLRLEKENGQGCILGTHVAGLKSLGR